MKTAKFVLNFTRDTTLIIQELWIATQTAGLERDLGLPPLPSIGVIDFINQGVIEIWENAEVVKHLQDYLGAFAEKEPDRLLKYLANYQENLGVFEKFWHQGLIKTVDELKKFVSLVEKYMPADAVAMYLAEDERTPEPVKSKAASIRAADHFFAYNNAVIRKSLEFLFSKLGPAVIYLHKKELSDGIAVSANELQERFKHYICCAGFRAVQTLAQYEKEHPEYIFVKERLQGEIIKGSVAQPGHARGAARLIRRREELQAVQPGDVIVAAMTTPDFVPALKKVVAILTDEGGALCHAAVISRELKIPCITGTKIATKVLKNGDTVEVDAEKGIVRKIS